jgi:F-box and leucine-rich repeat protein GRR1
MTMIEEDMERMSVRTRIDQLPPELLNIVFAYLHSKREKWAFILVCKSFFNSCVDDVWFRPQFTSHEKLASFVAVLSTTNLSIGYASLVRRLNLTSVYEHVNDEALRKLSVLTHLERLTISNCMQLTDDGVIPIIKNNPNLQSIDLSNNDLLTDRTIQTLAAHCPKLGGVYASNCKLLTDHCISQLAHGCALLKRVKLNGCYDLKDECVYELIRNCPLLVEIDLSGCANITNELVTAALEALPQLRELRLQNHLRISDKAFLSLPASAYLEKLRIIDLTACSLVTDDTVYRLVAAAPKLRNVVLAKCVNITDMGIHALTRLGKSLHYLHLGHCANITDSGINALVRCCHRILYIDVACCTQLTNAAVKDLATLPRLRRIGLVKCQNITDDAIYALAHKNGDANTLERIHLSYCGNITLLAILRLVNACQKLTHLSLTGVPPFMRHDLTQYCRPPPPEFTQHQQAVFCVFSGSGVDKLRDHLNMLLNENPDSISPLVDHQRYFTVVEDEVEDDVVGFTSD